MTLGGYRLGPLLKKTGKEILDDNVLGLAAETAYYFFFSLFPLLLFSIPLVGLIGDPQQIVAWIMSKLGQTLPGDALELVRGVVQQTVLAPSAPGLVSIGALLALWTGSNVFSTLTAALNTAYDVQESRAFWQRRLLAIAAVIVTGLLVLVANVAMLGGPQIADWIDNHTPVGHAFAVLWSIVQWPLAFSILVLALFLVYYFLPNIRQSVRHTLVGAVVAAALWVIVTLAFRFYVQNFGSYNKTYGTIGSVIILLTWMYLTMLVTLSAGELNSELHQGTGAVEPRGGVTYAGRITTVPDPSTPSTGRVRPARGLRPRRT